MILAKGFKHKTEMTQKFHEKTAKNESANLISYEVMKIMKEAIHLKFS